jgi:hypothetical protein
MECREKPQQMTVAVSLPVFMFENVKHFVFEDSVCCDVTLYHWFSISDALHSFEMSGNANPLTQYHIKED